MIPKRIHYVWLGGKKYPSLIRKCIKSWHKQLPDFEFKCWNEGNIPHNTWIDEAIKAKKWAFVADYVRLYALFNEGGIYLDTDVYIKKNFSNLLDTPFFIPIEFNEQKFLSTKSDQRLDSKYKRVYGLIEGLTAQSAVIGSEKNNPMLKKMMEYYERNHFMMDDGAFCYKYLAPDVIATTLEEYGFIYKNENYSLYDKNHNVIGTILDSSTFTSGLLSDVKDCYGIHMYSTTWQDYSLFGMIKYKIKLYLKSFLIQFR